MSKIAELFGQSVTNSNVNWKQIISEQQCGYSSKKCYKIRKSDPDNAIGSCTVLYGRKLEPIIICPTRLIEHYQIFTDCLHLLIAHEPGNELHLLSEISIPGGNVDYFLVSTKNGKVKDFVGVELQTLDTTGTVWPERQKLLKQLNVARSDNNEESDKTFGINWKMTAKTILIQIHHKIQTFEYLNKKLVLVMQDKLLNYMGEEFKFDHLCNPASIGDSMHFHAYRLNIQVDKSYKLAMQSRLSTDANGISLCLGLQTESRLELEKIIQILQAKISSNTLFTPF